MSHPDIVISPTFYWQLGYTIFAVCLFIVIGIFHLRIKKPMHSLVLAILSLACILPIAIGYSGYLGKFMGIMNPETLEAAEVYGMDNYLMAPLKFGMSMTIFLFIALFIVRNYLDKKAVW